MTPIDFVVWVLAAGAGILVAALAISISIIMINTARRQK